MHTHYTTFTEDFLSDAQKRNTLKELFYSTKFLKVDYSTGEILREFLHDSVRDKREYKSANRLKGNSNFRKLKEKISELYGYELSFKDVNPERAKLDNFYDGRKHNALIGILDKVIQGSYIGILEYGVRTGIHAHIFCGKQNSKLLSAEDKLTDETFIKAISYLSKPIITPVKLGEFRTNYHKLRDDYEVTAGRVIELQMMRQRRCRQVIYRINKKITRLHSKKNS